MTHRSSSLPLIKWIDWIVSRPPNKVSYLTLYGKKIKAIARIEQELRMKCRKCKICYDYVDIENKAKNISKTIKLNRPGNENKNKSTKSNIEDDGEEDGVTRAA